MTPGVVVAVDVGGTTIKGALVDDAGRASQELNLPTPVADGPEAVVDAVRDTVARLAAAGDVRAVGVAVPGLVSPDLARYSANLGWRDVPAAAFAPGLAVPVVLDHDVRCAGLAERAFGAARGADEACVIVIGTGIAAVSVCAGVPVRGARGLGGELGHVPVRPGGEPCVCGQAGCLEAYASAAAVARRYAARTGLAGAAHEVVARLGADPDADAVWADAVAALGTACITVTMLQDPEVITLAGGLANAGDALLHPLRAEVARGLAWREPPRVELSPLGDRAGRDGVALRAWQAAGRRVLPDGWVRG